nr:uncharacterized protein LOC109184329 [Ipomoea trifida]
MKGVCFTMIRGGVPTRGRTRRGRPSTNVSPVRNIAVDAGPSRSTPAVGVNLGATAPPGATPTAPPTNLPNTPPLATQADIIGISTVVANLIRQQQGQQDVTTQSSYFERFRRVNPPTFNGGPDPTAAERWIKELEKLFDAMQYPNEVKVERAAHPDGVSWQDFKRIFFDNFFPDSLKTIKENEFLDLKQGSMTVLEYAHKFHELGQFCLRYMIDDRDKARKFERGLRPDIRDKLCGTIFTTYLTVYMSALKAEAELNKQAEYWARKKRAGPKMSKEDSGSSNKKRGVGFHKKVNTCGYCHQSHTGPCHRKTGACFGCGQHGHLIKNCPSMKKNEAQAANPKKVNARVFAMTQQDVDKVDNVVAGIIPLNTVDAYVLCDSGSSHCFISKKFAKNLNLQAKELNEPLYVSTPMGKIVMTDTWFQDCHLQLNGGDVSIDLIQLDMHDFDVILGMDWLSKNYAHIDCARRKVVFQIPGQPIFTLGHFPRSGVLVSRVPLKVISALKAKKELRKGCSGFLAYAVEVFVEKNGGKTSRSCSRPPEPRRCATGSRGHPRRCCYPCVVTEKVAPPTSTAAVAERSIAHRRSRPSCLSLLPLRHNGEVCSAKAIRKLHRRRPKLLLLSSYSLHAVDDQKRRSWLRSSP